MSINLSVGGEALASSGHEVAAELVMPSAPGAVESRLPESDSYEVLTADSVAYASCCGLVIRRAPKARQTGFYGQLADSTDPFESVEFASIWEEVRGFLNRDQEDVLILTVVHNYSVAEAANILGIPLGTAKTRRHYGVQNLRKALRGEHKNGTLDVPWWPKLSA